MSLADYRETIDPNSPEIVLLKPAGNPDAYFAEFGWKTDNAAVKIPDASTLWHADARRLGREAPVTMTWDNGQGLAFTKEVAVDDNFMFTVTRRVTNNGAAPVTLDPYALISRWGTRRRWATTSCTRGRSGCSTARFMRSNTRISAKPGGDVQLRQHRRLDRHQRQILAGHRWYPTSRDAITADFRYTPQGDQPRYQVDYLG